MSAKVFEPEPIPSKGLREMKPDFFQISARPLTAPPYEQSGYLRLKTQSQ